jgi:L-ribulose-5-phosphate 4-epimerase
MNAEEILSDYEANTGHVIARAFEHVDYRTAPAVLVASHGPFTWGVDVAEAAHNAVILEAIARTASLTLGINNGLQPIARELHDKHFFRKHGHQAYYGQAGKTK